MQRMSLLSIGLLFLSVFMSIGSPIASAAPGDYFKITVVDSQTKRGVPLVELRTTNSIRYWTDSNGIVAVNEPGLMGQRVFFTVFSHGYEYPKDGFGSVGKALLVEPGGSAVIEIKRTNIAHRLYRITGQGIYRDSILTGTPTPLKNPVINGLVMGQDSVFTVVYGGRLYWFWGDTARPSYPLGHFAMSGAVSQLPSKGGLDPAVGVDLEYFIDETGFSRPVAPLKEGGLVWLDGFMTVPDSTGRTRMVAGFARLKTLDVVLERGLMVWNDDSERFEPVVRGGKDLLPFSNTAHAFPVDVSGQRYYYFSAPAPAAPRLRVRADYDHATDPNRYEVFTDPMQQSIRAQEHKSTWISYADLAKALGGKQAVIDALKGQTKDIHLYDIETGDKVVSHNGTVNYNPYRKRWIAIVCQVYGKPSMLGETWYAEADTPVGPFTYARRIITHDKYSFYNPAHHGEFDKDGGRTIFLEGTYTHTFSGTPENATARYDYNQIMYSLDLADPRLTLPQPVYKVQTPDNQTTLMLAEGLRSSLPHPSSIAFYAVGPDRKTDNLIPIYRTSGTSLTKTPPSENAHPLFYGLREKPDNNSMIIPLRESDSPDAPILCYV
ncbi:MAG TPA: hypothetical protein ENN81_09215, partial [Phycisphaerales bacterium]|nr:hypothetical protein [Phycisphaerales bacterium]